MTIRTPAAQAWPVIPGDTATRRPRRQALLRVAGRSIARALEPPAPIAQAVRLRSRAPTRTVPTPTTGSRRGFKRWEIDLAGADRDLVRVLRGRGDATFAAARRRHVQPATVYPRDYGSGSHPIVYVGTTLATGDFDGDGRLDVAENVYGASERMQEAAYVAVHLGNGDGTFRTSTATASSTSHRWRCGPGGARQRRETFRLGPVPQRARGSRATSTAAACSTSCKPRPAAIQLP
jgi:hypothetical protein